MALVVLTLGAKKCVAEDPQQIADLRRSIMKAGLLVFA